MSDQEEENAEAGAEEGDQGQGSAEAQVEPQSPPPPKNPLTKELLVAGLGLLCKVGNGIDHAYVRADVRGKDLTDIEALRSYRHLRFVDISENKVGDLSPLEALQDLVSLKADKNPVDALRLPALPYLQDVSLQSNRLTDASPLALANLTSLNVAGNKISRPSLSGSNVPRLSFLDLRHNDVISLAGLGSLASLTTLYIGQNVLTTLTGISSLVNLTRLHLRQNQIASLDGFSADNTRLEYINLRQNMVAELAEIQKLRCLPALKALVLSDNPVADSSEYRMEILINLRKLVRLDKVDFEQEERIEAGELAARREAQAQPEGSD